jgi:regulator of nonsense transcripts 2
MGVRFSVLAKTYQTRTVELPSDSNFAVAMINQRQAAKEEQQRIKNLVLNLDLRENEEHDGEENLTPYGPHSNIHHSSAGPEKPPSHHHHNRPENRSGKERGQRVRKLQLSDVDWYDNNPGTKPLQEREQVRTASQGRPKGVTANRRRRNVWQQPVRGVVAREGRET